MESASIRFVLFGLAVALLSNLSPAARWRTVILLSATILFLAKISPSPAMWLPFAGFLAAGYGFIILARHRPDLAISAAILSQVVLFAWLKRYSLLAPIGFLPFSYVTIGLSYVFFRVLHLIVEAQNTAHPAARISPLRYLTYTLNFTTFISGPIQRYEEFEREQFAATPLPLSGGTILAQAERIAMGMFKVNVLGTGLSILHGDAVATLLVPQPVSTGLATCLLVIVSYPFYLYLNFSGYIDIVIAIARLMRLELPENFNRPFSATSFIEFWNRWHITLSQWLKNYIYNPLLILLIRRNSNPAAEPYLGVLCFFVTFFLVGIWHGRTSEFLLFGVLQGGGVAVNKLWQVLLTRRLGRKSYRALAAKPLYAALARGLTFTWFALTLILFWADWVRVERLVDALSSGRWVVLLMALWAGASIVLALWEWQSSALARYKPQESTTREWYGRVALTSALAVTVGMFLFALSQAAPEIVYKTF